MKERKAYIITVKRNILRDHHLERDVTTYLVYRVIKGKGVTMTWKQRYEALKDNATVFNSYGKALAVLIDLDNSKDCNDIKACESYDIIEKGATL